MSHPALSATLGRLARAADPDPPADGRLVTRFARTRDPDAFAELVRRVGPMVLGVCRRVTGDSHLADDAFQAAFLVLARRAGRVERPDEIRGWMYGVAVRVAREARSVSARRRAREAPVPTLPDRPAESHPPPDADALRALDEEVAALPEHVRAAVVLCELDGVSRKDAAGRLGVPEGTVSSRLATGRKLLAARLRRRGVAALGLAALAPAAVPPRLTAAASALGSGDPAPAAVAALAHGVVRAMVVQKLKLAPLAVAALVPAVLAAGLFPGPTAAAPPRPVVPALRVAQPTPPPKVAPRPGHLYVVKDGSLLKTDPTGKDETKLAGAVQSAAPSPDGKWLALSTVAHKGDITVITSALRRVGAKDDQGVSLVGDLLFPGSVSFVWSPDSARVAVRTMTQTPPDADGRPGANLVTRVYDVAAKKAVSLDVPDGFTLAEWFPDGKTMLGTVGLFGGDAKQLPRVARLAPGAAPEPLTPAGTWAVAGRVSPDGTRVLFTHRAPGGKESNTSRLSALDLKTGKTTRVSEADNVWVGNYAWSPDGTRVAYDAQVVIDPPPAEPAASEPFVVVCAADGSDQRTVLTHSVAPRTAILPGLHLIDWR